MGVVLLPYSPSNMSSPTQQPSPAPLDLAGPFPAPPTARHDPDLAVSFSALSTTRHDSDLAGSLQEGRVSLIEYVCFRAPTQLLPDPYNIFDYTGKSVYFRITHPRMQVIACLYLWTMHACSRKSYV